MSYPNFRNIYDRQYLEQLSYQQLRNICSHLGIPANIKKVYMIKLIEADGMRDQNVKAEIFAKIKEERLERSQKKLLNGKTTRTKKRQIQFSYTVYSNDNDKHTKYTEVVAETVVVKTEPKDSNHCGGRSTPFSDTSQTVTLPRNHSLRPPIELKPRFSPEDTYQHNAWLQVHKTSTAAETSPHVCDYSQLAEYRRSGLPTLPSLLYHSYPSMLTHHEQQDEDGSFDNRNTSDSPLELLLNLTKGSNVEINNNEANRCETANTEDTTTACEQRSDSTSTETSYYSNQTTTKPSTFVPRMHYQDSDETERQESVIKQVSTFKEDEAIFDPETRYYHNAASKPSTFVPRTHYQDTSETERQEPASFKDEDVMYEQVVDACEDSDRREFNEDGVNENEQHMNDSQSLPNFQSIIQPNPLYSSYPEVEYNLYRYQDNTIVTNSQTYYASLYENQTVNNSISYPYHDYSAEMNTSGLVTTETADNDNYRLIYCSEHGCHWVPQSQIKRYTPYN